MADFEEHENYSHVNEHEENDEEGLVEYLEIDSEVMDTLQDPNGYFAQVNPSHTGQIYVQQNSANTQQLSLVIQNQSASNEYTALKQISSQHLDHNGVTNVLWSNSILNSNDNKATAKIENSRKSTNGRKNCKTKRKRKIESINSPNDDTKYSNQQDVVADNNEEIQSESDSLDLFFQSMAQTVSHLPPRIQAKIKMNICNVISMAEIKYCSQKTNLHNNLNEDFSSKN